MDLDAMENRSKTLVAVRTLTSYWRNKGYDIKCAIEEEDEGVFIIKSNIGPTGFPPKV